VLLPDWNARDIEPHLNWLAPTYYDPAADRIVSSIHSWVLKTRHHTILIDTCVGNHKERPGQPRFHMLDRPYMENFAGAGLKVEDIDYVLCTHLHVDHVGWNTRLDNGRWVPTFPRARHLFARAEWEHWSRETDDDTQRIMADSVKPVLDAGLATLVEMDHRVSNELWLEPTPGHTPGHVSVRLRSGDAEAVITGDLMHCPVQVAEPGWGSHFDSDVEAARKTRRAFCERYADGPVRVLGTHFHHPTAGRIRRHRDSWRFVVED
jgi:glyoxylase-like metal-dependent hydrolase (beta-lactamase superfamily II)